jgi:putative N6-adenine-specific DNA methylase
MVKARKFSVFLPPMAADAMENNFTMVAKTFFGFEEILARELQILGAQQVRPGTRMVSFVGDKGFMYKANLALRTALKILKPIHSFRATNEEWFTAASRA